MSYTEKQIKHESGEYWVLDTGASYIVFHAGVTHSTSESAYARTPDGLSIAKARADYLSKTKGKP